MESRTSQRRRDVVWSSNIKDWKRLRPNASQRTNCLGRQIRSKEKNSEESKASPAREAKADDVEKGFRCLGELGSCASRALAKTLEFLGGDCIGTIYPSQRLFNLFLVLEKKKQ